MGAAVRVDASAFSDERYSTLARVAGLADEDHARGKMLRLWRHCTDRHVHVVSADLVESILGANGCAALLRSELGELTEGGIRICGTAGRIEWLDKLRQNGKRGGRPRSGSDESHKGELLDTSQEASGNQMVQGGESKTKAHQEKEKEISVSSLPPSALSAADQLHAELCAEQPSCKVAKLDWPTSRERLGWARELRLLHERDGRSWEDISAAIRWLFREQTGDARFVVQSGAALREKWDRIAAVRSRAARAPASRQPFAPQRTGRPLQNLADLPEER